MSILYIQNGASENRSLHFNKDLVYIGRSAGNDIQIKEKHISRTHLKVTRKHGRYFIEDLGSENGTYVKGELIPPNRESEINPGDPVRIGNTIFSVDEPYRDNVPSFLYPIGASDCHKNTAEIDRPWTPAKNFELIYKVSTALTQSLDINETLERILDYIFDLMKRIERGAIVLIDPLTRKITDVISRTKDGTRDISALYSRSVVNRVIREHKPVVLCDALEEKGCDRSESMEALRVKCVLCVPLISRSKVRGALYVDSQSSSHGFRNADVDLLTILSGPAAVAIENAMLYSSLQNDVQDKSRILLETEKRLHKSESHLKAIFDNMKSGVVLFEGTNKGEDFVILDLNKAAQRIEKVRKRVVVGKDAAEVFPWIKDTGLLDAFRETVKTNQPSRKTVLIMRGEHERAWKEFYLYNLPSGEIVAIYDDVTDKVKAQEEHDALQEQLFASQKMESIGALAGGIAHNFRNILQAISGNIEYLEVQQCDLDEMKKVLKGVHNSVERAVDLINSLLQFSKKGGRLEVTNLDISGVITETYEIAKKLIDRKIDIQLDLEKELFVKGNRSLMGQVFLNLLTNAKDAMPEGGNLRVEARKEGSAVLISVSDTGIGMDREVQKRIFEPFFTLKEVGKGTGLGLSTCLGIIEQHKGTIDVSSTPGKGSIFKIRLPSSLNKQTNSVVSSKLLKRGSGQKILIVDDEEPTLSALCNLVKALNYEAIPCKRSVTALETFDLLRPELVLVDRNMPELDGITCMKKIIKKHPGTKFIIISGYEDSGPQDIDEETRALITGYIVKPGRLESLSNILDQALAA
jgi:signal transduction histidine kinase/CheY-like chemotaxis protein